MSRGKTTWCSRTQRRQPSPLQQVKVGIFVSGMFGGAIDGKPTWRGAPAGRIYIAVPLVIMHLFHSLPWASVVLLSGYASSGLGRWLASSDVLPTARVCLRLESSTWGLDLQVPILIVFVHLLLMDLFGWFPQLSSRSTKFMLGLDPVPGVPGHARSGLTPGVNIPDLPAGPVGC